MSNKSCCIDFESSKAFNKEYETYVFAEDYVPNKEDILLCPRNHELSFVKYKNRRSHFRHKNIGDTHMSEWHEEWQSHFLNTEIQFRNTNQIKNRRSDVELDENNVIEFQYSKISLEEVNNRNSDYAINNKNVIWIIDGNNIDITEKKEDVFDLDFKDRNEWKYLSFINCKHVYYDINGIIFSCSPSLIKSEMISVEKGIEKMVFINMLKQSYSIPKNTDIKQSKITIKQQGPGSGKTYNSVKICHDDKEYSGYEVFIFLTKMNSAKHVIKTELEEQFGKKVMEFEIDNIKEGKKYVVSFDNKIVIIATLDSFLFNIGHKEYNKDPDMFINMVKSVIEYGIKMAKNGNITYVNKSIRMCKKTLIILDEAQDTPLVYGKALEKIMKETYSDLYIIGDKLQSLSNEHNTHTYFLGENFENIDKVILPFTNECRRWTNTYITDLINYMVDFNKYGLPSLTTVYQTEEEDGVQIYNLNHNFIEKDDIKLFNEDINTVMQKYKNEVEKYDRLPEDFIIVTPFTKKNYFVDSLSTAIESYWLDKLRNDKTYIENVLVNNEWWKNFDMKKRHHFCYFHKSEEGNSIDLNDSTHSTRIVSIHSSKGDGRKVLFIIGLNDKALIKFGKKNSLIYESLVNVALSRVKEKLYLFIYPDAKDTITKKVIQWQMKRNKENIPCIVDYKLHPYDKINIYKNIDSTDFESINDLILNKFEKENFEYKDSNIIDLKHHQYRYMSMYMLLLLNVMYYQHKNNLKDSVHTMLNKLRKCHVRLHDSNQEYNDHLYKIYKNREGFKDQKKYVDIFTFNNNSKYTNKVEFVKSSIKNIKYKLDCFFEKNERQDFGYIDSVILYYMIQVSEEGIKSDIFCKDLFEIIDIIEGNNIYKQCHYINILSVQTQFEYITNIYDNLSFLINHKFYYQGCNKSKDFNVHNSLSLIAYTQNEILVFYIKPQYNLINHNEIKINSLSDTFLIKNSTPDLYERYKTDSVKTILLSTDLELPKIFDWIIEKDCLINKETNKVFFTKLIQTQLQNTYFEEAELFWAYMKQELKGKLNDRDISNFLKLYTKNEGKNKDIFYDITLEMKGEIKRLEKSKYRDVFNIENFKNYISIKINNYLYEKQETSSEDEDEDEISFI